jgi:hypothetical protein
VVVSKSFSKDKQHATEFKSFNIFPSVRNASCVYIEQSTPVEIYFKNMVTKADLHLYMLTLNSIKVLYMERSSLSREKQME